MEGKDWVAHDMDLQSKPVLEGLLGHTNPHILPMCYRRSRILQAHTMLHVIGSENTPEHDEVLDMLEVQERLLRRAFDALWC